MEPTFSARNYFGEGQQTDLNQGAVFIGAYAEDYAESVNYGLVITARCDIAQDKAKKYSYMPLVSLVDWMKFDFVELLIKRVTKAAQNSVVSTLKSIGGSELLLKTYPLAKIQENYKEQGSAKQRKSFTNACRKLELLDSVNDLPVSDEMLNQLIASFESDAKAIIQQLIAQNLTGYYFVDDVLEGGACIALLREIHHLKRDTALALRTGIRIDDGSVNYPDDSDLSYTIGTIKSPYIEHVMQKFSELFIRIGIDDPDANAAEIIIGNYKNEE